MGSHRLLLSTLWSQGKFITRWLYFLIVPIGQQCRWMLLNSQLGHQENECIQKKGKMGLEMMTMIPKYHHRGKRLPLIFLLSFSIVLHYFFNSIENNFILNLNILVMSWSFCCFKLFFWGKKKE